MLTKFKIAGHLALTATALLFAGAASASPKARATTPAAQPAPDASMQQRYCVVDTITGSILPQKVCKTRGDWIAQGWDPAKRQ
jgi:hypothetical protein